MALPDDIFQTIADLGRRVFNLESNPQPPNITLSNQVQASFSLPGNDWGEITVTLSNGDANRLVAMPTFTVYKSAIAADDAFPAGANWTDDQRENIQITSWIDWGETDNNNVKFKVYLVNKTATNFIDLKFRCNFRFLQREASTS